METTKINWKDAVSRNIFGYAMWSTPLGAMVFCGILECLRFGRPNENPEEKEELLYVSFSWIASIAGNDYNKEGGVWRKVSEESWHQTLNPEQETCEVGVDPDKGTFYRIASMVVYPEWEGKIKKEEVQGL